MEIINKMSQKDAVHRAITEALPKDKLAFTMQELLTKEVKKKARKILFDLVKSGKVVLNVEYDDKRLKKYCSGLLNNWIKKDKRNQ